MRQLLVIIVDSLRESRDRRSLTVLLALSLAPILFCFGVSFEPEPMTGILEKQAADLTNFRQDGGHRTRRHHHKRPEIGEVTPVEEGEGWAPTLASGHAIELVWESEKTLDELAVAWFQFRDHGFRRDDDTEVAAVIDGQPRAVRFLEQRFAQFGYENVEVRVDPGAGGGTRARVAVRADEPATLEGAHTINLMFGYWSFEYPEVSIAAFVIHLESGLAQVFVGGLGMLVALMACSAFVPNMLQKGTLDLVLARPISRARLLLAKYFGGLWFVFVLATFMVVGCWIGLAIGSGYTNPWFLVSILTVTAGFAVIYSVSVLIGVLTRSAGISALVAIGLWWFSNTLVGAAGRFRSGAADGNPRRRSATLRRHPCRAHRRNRPAQGRQDRKQGPP